MEEGARHEEDVDAGWDDAPESQAVPVKAAVSTTAPKPVSTVPARPASIAPMPTASVAPLPTGAPPSATSRPRTLSPPPKPTASRPPVVSSAPPPSVPPPTVLTAPRATTHTPSLPPVTSVPRPRSWVPPVAAASAPSIGGTSPRRDEPVLVADTKRRTSDAPTIEVGDEVVDEASALDEALTDGATEAMGHGTPTAVAPVASEPDLPDFRRRTPGRAALGVLVGTAIAVVVAGVGWRHFAKGRERASAIRAEPVPAQPAPPRAPEPPNPVPVPPPALPVTNEAPTTPPPAPEATTVSVKIKVYPEGAVIFRAGQRLGTGAMEVNVERKVKQRLTALHDGYLPLNFTLDGSRDAVTIRLKRVPKSQPEVDPSASPVDAPSEPANAGTVPTPPAPAPVEGTWGGSSEPGG